MEKHPACAATINSSGFVPGWASNRDPTEYLPSKAPLPNAIVPFPLTNSPSQIARAVRIGMTFLLVICRFYNISKVYIIRFMTVFSWEYLDIGCRRAIGAIYQ